MEDVLPLNRSGARRRCRNVVPRCVVVAVALLLASSSLQHPFADGTTATKGRITQLPRRRQVWAWASGLHAKTNVAQLRNASWAGIFDGVQAFCSVMMREDGTGLDVTNETIWKGCIEELKPTVQDEAGMKFHIVLGGRVPDEHPVQPMIDAAIAFCRKWNLNGISLDDEYDCAPRSALSPFKRWMSYVNALASGVKAAAGLDSSAAVQSMFGIQDVPYNPYCGPNHTHSPSCGQACKYLPRDYLFEPRVAELLSSTELDRWLVMDTYYFTTGRFLGSLAWYLEYAGPLEKIGIGVMNRPGVTNDTPLTEDGMVARFHAMSSNNVEWINFFILPADDQWLPYLRRWKTYCAGCGNQIILGCYDMSVPCNDTVQKQALMMQEGNLHKDDKRVLGSR